MTSLAAVRVSLQAPGSKNATLFTSLMNNYKLAPYKSKETLNRKINLTGASQLWYPSLGKKQAPIGFRELSIKQLQKICLRDLPASREYYGDRIIYFSQSGASDGSTEMSMEGAGMRTINSMTNANIDSTKSIVTFPSETLEDICNEGAEQPANLLRATMTTCTILPNDTFMPLHHNNEGTTITTVLSGSITWIIWPPTNHNIRTLQTAYDNFAEDFDETKMDVVSDLEGGMIFVQTEGDGLRIPPFCLMMNLATKGSVLTTKSYVTVENYISMLQKLSFLKAWYRTELDAKHTLPRFNASILTYLDLMLNGFPEHEVRNKLKLPATTKDDLPGTLLGSLLSIWDDIKDNLAAMMGPEDSKAMVNIWGDFLIAAKGRKCWICNKEIRNKQRHMAKHFAETHWAKVKVAKRIDSLEVEEEGGDIDGQAEDQVMIDDSMDLNA